MAFYPVADKKMPSPVKNALKKKSGMLTVSLEVFPSDTVQPVDAGEMSGDARRTVELTGDERLSKISADLRGGREGALCATVWTPDIDSVGVLVKEQASAKGDFPGPCPVVYTGDAAHAADAVAAGASGVVLRAEQLEMAHSLATEVVWHVSSEEDIERIVSDEQAPEDGFLLDAAEAAALLPSLPSSAVGVVALDAMLPDDGEVELGREMVASHKVKALLVRDACVGDVEDLPYAKYVVKQLTSKKSASFAIDGHTGSTNGHFGGSRGAAASRPDDGWSRVRS